MFKDIFEFILISIILTYAWRLMSRLLFPQNLRRNSNNNSHENSAFSYTKPKEKHGLNWDAEDAEFEEIKDEEKLKK